jgi:hypothetical protein
MLKSWGAQVKNFENYSAWQELLIQREKGTRRDEAELINSISFDGWRSISVDRFKLMFSIRNIFQKKDTIEFWVCGCFKVFERQSDESLKAAKEFLSIKDF